MKLCLIFFSKISNRHQNRVDRSTENNEHCKTKKRLYIGTSYSNAENQKKKKDEVLKTAQIKQNILPIVEG